MNERMKVKTENFLVCCLHILLEKNQEKRKSNTWKWIRDNGKLKISKKKVFDIIQNWLINPNIIEGKEEKIEIILNELKDGQNSSMETLSNYNSYDDEKFHPKKHKIQKKGNQKKIKSEENPSDSRLILHVNLERIKDIDDMAFAEKSKDNTIIETTETNMLHSPMKEIPDSSAELSCRNFTDEMIELVKTQCGKHSVTKMSSALNVEKQLIDCWLAKNPVTFAEDEENCFFCDENSNLERLEKKDDWQTELLPDDKTERPQSPVKDMPELDHKPHKQLTDEMIDIIKARCGKHSVFSMSTILNVKKSALEYILRMNPVIFSEQEGKCFFCEKNQLLVENGSQEPSTHVDEKYRYITQEDIELVKRQCGEHPVAAISEYLNVGPSSLKRRLRKLEEEKVVFSKHRGNCHFCENGCRVRTKNIITNEMIDAVKTQCGKHRLSSMCNLLKVTKPCLKSWIEQNGNAMSKDIITDCKFCQMETNEDKIIECPTCKATFETKKHYLLHISKEGHGKKYKKTPNSKKQKRRDGAADAAYFSDLPFPCKICNKRFAQDYYLVMHIKNRHERKKTFLCSMCPISFTVGWRLERHVQTVHENKKPFKCAKCDYSTHYKQSLTNHISTHEGRKKPHLCNICGVSFADKGNLRKHIAAIHHGMKREMWKKTNLKLTIGD